MSRVLIVGDLHCPADHPKYLKFCKDLYRKWKCTSVIFIGDIVDWHSVSFHAHNPELPAPKDEYELSMKCVQRWYKAFPKATVTIGNHDDRLIRKAGSADIPEFFLRKYQDIWQTPGWNWVHETIVDKVYYYHGIGSGGLYPAFNKCRQLGMSVVSGHTHAAAGIWWTASPLSRFFGMNVGCGVDNEAMQMEYGRNFARKPIVSAGVVLDGTPYHEICPIGMGEKYAKDRKAKNEI